MPDNVVTHRTALALVALLLVGFAVRCRFIGDVLLEGVVVPFDPDSFYHLWRIEEAVRGGAAPHFDRFANAPVGAEVIYPDGFATLAAAAVRGLFGAQPSRFQIEVTSLLLQPILGALALLALYALAARVAGRRAGLAAAAVGALLPAHVLAGFLGRVDHHVFEVALPPLVLAALLGAPAASRARTAAVVLLAGLALAALFACAPTAALHAVLLAAAVAAGALGATVAGERSAAAALLGKAAGAFAIAALFLVPMALAWPRLAFDAPSALPTVLLGALAAAIAALTVAARRGARVLAAVLGAGGLLAGAVAAIALREVARFIAGQGLLALIDEVQPVWASPRRAFGELSLALPALPLAAVALAWSHRTPAAWAVAATTLGGFVLTSFQARFSHLLVPAAVALLGTIATTEWARRGARGRALLVAGAAVVMAPCAWYLSETGLAPLGGSALLEASTWLARNSPPVGERTARDAAPWTVLARPEEGNLIAYASRRPLVGSAMISHDYGPGYADSLALLFGDGNEALMAHRRVRYLLLTALGSGPEAALRSLAGGAGPLPTLYSRLFDQDGSALGGGDGQLLPALDRFRLRHESPLRGVRDGRDVPAVKVFERVEGASVSGPCDAPLVRARVNARSDAGRDFSWVAATACTAGRFAVRVPYAGRLEIKLRGGAPAVRVEVDEEAVRSGREIAVPAPEAAR